jgi:hypothetical protein
LTVDWSPSAATVDVPDRFRGGSPNLIVWIVQHWFQLRNRVAISPSAETPNRDLSGSFVFMLQEWNQRSHHFGTSRVISLGVFEYVNAFLTYLGLRFGHQFQTDVRVLHVVVFELHIPRSVWADFNSV